MSMLFSANVTTFVLRFRLKYQSQASGDTVRVAQDDSFQWKYVKAAFLDWQIWVNIWVYWGIVAPLYGISLFLPTIIRGLGYTSSTAQLLTVPIYITASILAVAVAYCSDRLGKRSPFILVCLGIVRATRTQISPMWLVQFADFVKLLLILDGGWIHHVHCNFDIRSHLRWRLHCGLCIISSFPRQYHVAIQQ